MSEVLASLETTPEWLDTLSKLLPPFIALGGAIWLYFLERKKERADALRAARLEVYSDYLQSISKLSENFSRWPLEKVSDLFQELARHDDKIKLVAPFKVARASKHFVESALSIIFSEVNAKTPDLKIDLERSLGENVYANFDTLKESRSHRNEFVKARKQLLIEMRSDLFSGTGETAVDIDNLWDERK